MKQRKYFPAAHVNSDYRRSIRKYLASEAATLTAYSNVSLGRETFGWRSIYYQLEKKRVIQAIGGLNRADMHPGYPDIRLRILFEFLDHKLAAMRRTGQ